MEGGRPEGAGEGGGREGCKEGGKGAEPGFPLVACEAPLSSSMARSTSPSNVMDQLLPVTPQLYLRSWAVLVFIAYMLFVLAVIRF